MTCWSIFQVYKKGIKVVPRWDIIVIVKSIPCRCHRTTWDYQEASWAISPEDEQEGVVLWFSYWDVLYILSFKICVNSTWNLDARLSKNQGRFFRVSSLNLLIAQWLPETSSWFSLLLFFCILAEWVMVSIFLYCPKMLLQIHGSESCWMAWCSEHQDCYEVKSCWKHHVFNLTCGKRTKKVISPVLCISKHLLYFT